MKSSEGFLKNNLPDHLSLKINRVTSYAYDIFGKLYQGKLSNSMPFGNTGKPLDTATGLYNYGFRNYKPDTRRFTTVEPIKDGSNWYAYCGNDPVNSKDYLGLCKNSPGDKEAAGNKIRLEDKPESLYVIFAYTAPTDKDRSFLKAAKTKASELSGKAVAHSSSKCESFSMKRFSRSQVA